MKGAQVTNKPLRQIQLTANQPFCFEILHKNGRPISNLFIMPSDDSEFSYSIPRIRLMVECNRMRYYANFHPEQRMEHLKTLIFVLTGVMPRNQCLFYRQRMDSKLPFEGLLEGDAEEVVQTKDNLQSVRHYFNYFHTRVFEVPFCNNSNISSPFHLEARCRRLLQLSTWSCHRIIVKVSCRLLRTINVDLPIPGVNSHRSRNLYLSGHPTTFQTATCNNRLLKVLSDA